VATAATEQQRQISLPEGRGSPRDPLEQSTRQPYTYMGASLTMIDRHYGHLARDGREHAIRLLAPLNGPELERWTSVDAAWASDAPTVADRGNGKLL
jgi:hypothetical protein